MAVDDTADRIETSADVARSLQELRIRAGVTYADIAMRIATQRIAAGAPPSAARVARSTVFDAFKVDRTRLNPTLIGEIARALGESDDAVASWRERASRASLVRRDFERQVPPTPTLPRPVDVTAVPQDWWSRHGAAVVLVFACVAANLLGHRFVAAAEVPLFFDMIGTAIVAIAIGPWYGVLVAVVTNIAGVWLSDAVSAYFVAVNVAGALVWALGARRFAMARTAARFLMLNLLAALACSIVATPLIVSVLGGHSSHPLDALAASWSSGGQSPWVSTFVSNLANSVPDKLIAGFVTLVILSSLGSVAEKLSMPPDTVFSRLSSSGRHALMASPRGRIRPAYARPVPRTLRT